MLRTKAFIIKSPSKGYFRPRRVLSSSLKRISSKHFKFSLKNKKNESCYKHIKFDLLTIFYTIVSSGSINKAAERLLMTQPAVSLCLNKIESELGCLLIKQTPTIKGVNLTLPGLLFFNYIQRLFQLIEEALQISQATNSKFLAHKIFQAGINSYTLHQQIFFSPTKIYLSYMSKKLSPILKFNSFYTNLLKYYDLEGQNFLLFQTKSKLFLVQEKTLFLKNYKSPQVVKQNLSFSIFEVKDYISSTILNKRLSSLIFKNQLIEVQTPQAFSICLELNISELICWGGC